MAKNRKPHTVNIGGLEHTMLLTEQAAKEMYGDLAKPAKGSGEKAAQKPANKARTPQNK